MTVTYHVGDTREVIKGIPDGSVDLIASSPPFLALRSYVPADHVSKGNEIGSEANPAEFIDMLLGLTAEWGRVLAAHGSIAIELGDTYSGSGGAGGDYNEGGLRDGQGKVDGSARRGAPSVSPDGQTGHYTGRQLRPYGPHAGAGWPRAKSLALIPQLYAVALAYGINPLTGQPSPAGRWLVRNVIVWHRPNPAVGALGDKVRPSTSYIVVATRSPKRWFDLTAVRTEHREDPNRARNGLKAAINPARNDADEGYGGNPAGAPPLDAWFDPQDSDLAEAMSYDGSHDTWTLTTQPSRLAHYAMWPAKLAERLILMMCPREVCRVCGEPRRRIETHVRTVDGIPIKEWRADRPAPIKRAGWAELSAQKDGDPTANGSDPDLHVNNNRIGADRQTLGWSDCGCSCATCDGTRMVGSDHRVKFCPDCDTSRFRPGVVLDPFAGSGTTLAVADLHGRDAIGIDFDQRNHDLYPARYDEVKRALYGTPAPMPGQETFDFQI